jgi:hypothetical protein
MHMVDFDAGFSENILFRKDGFAGSKLGRF